jgi:hypothetical protein
VTIFAFDERPGKGLYLCSIGRRCNAAAIGLINLIYDLARYVRTDCAAEGEITNRRLKNED